jgi:hypothetical protein
VARGDPFRQRRGQPEGAPQARFLSRHFPIIVLVIKSRQMKNSMQREDFHFEPGRMAKPRSILGSNVGRDGNFPGESSFAVSLAR